MAKENNSWLDAYPVATEAEIAAAARPDAQRALPAGVAPSEAGGGRGVVNPPPAAHPRRTTLDELGRQLGLTVRASAKGAASIPGIVVDAGTGLINEAADLVAGKGNGPRIPTTTDAVDNLLTSIGVPQPEGALERVVQDAGQAMAGAGGIVKAGTTLAKSAAPTAAAVGKQLAAGPGLQVASGAAGGAASGATREAGGGTAAQIAAGVAGGLAPGFAGPAAAEATRRAMRGGEAGRKVMAENVKAFKDAGAEPTVGQASQRRTLQAAESLLSRTPGGAGVLAGKAQQQADDMAKTVQRISDAMAPGANSMKAGEAIERGVQSFKDRFKDQQRSLYGQLDKMVAKDRPVTVSRTQEALQALNEGIEGAPRISTFFQNAKLTSIEKALLADLDGAAAMQSARLMLPKSSNAPGQLPYEAVSKLRSLVGREIADSNLVSDVPRSKWAQVYAALSEDLGDAAKGAGPRAYQLWERANDYTRMGMERLDQLSKVVSRDAPEKIFTAAISGTAEGATTINRVMKALPAAERKEIAAAVLQRLGRATPGQQNAAADAFSSETFLTSLSKMSQAARQAIFGKAGDADLLARVEQIAKAAELRRTSGAVFNNPSGTAGATAQQALNVTAGASAAGAMFTGNVVPLAGALAVPAAANIAAKALAHPRVVGFGARATEVAPGAAASAVGTAGRVTGAEGEQDLSWLDQYEIVEDPRTPVQATPSAAPEVPAQPMLDPAEAATAPVAPTGLPAPTLEPAPAPAAALPPVATPPPATPAPAAAAPAQPATPAPHPRLGQIQRLRDAGDTATADHLQRIHDRAMLPDVVRGELAGMQEVAPGLPIYGKPEFETEYQALRGGGMKAPEAAARASMAALVRSSAGGIGLSEKAVAAMLDKAAGLDIDKVPAFMTKFAQAMAAKGAAKPLQNAGQVEKVLAALRDDALQAAVAHAYREPSPEPAPEPEVAAATPAKLNPAVEQVLIDSIAEAARERQQREEASAKAIGDTGPDFTAEPRQDGTLLLRGDSKAIRETLIAAGIPANAIMSSRTGVTVGRTQADKVQAALDRLQVAAAVDEGAHQAAASPLNDRPEPTKAQILAGNAPLGHFRLAGMPVSIESPAGSVREDKNNDPPQWRTPMRGAHYGYWRQTVAADSTKAKRQGVDGFFEEGVPADYSGPVFVIDQLNRDGTFDEHKTVVVKDGDEGSARDLYLRHYEPGWQGLGAITALPMAAFKSWVRDGAKKKPLGNIQQTEDA